MSPLPPLRLAVPALAAAWALVFEVPRFVGLVVQDAAANDFRLIYVSAKVGLNSGWSHMYDPGLQEAIAKQLTAYNPISAIYTYEFPPLLAWIVVPLTLLPIAGALYVWTAVNVASFVGASRLAFPGDVYKWLAVLLVSLAIWPSVFSLERGQPVLIVFALAILSWWLAARGRDRWAGVALGVAWALKPQVLLLLPIAFLMAGKPRATTWWLLTTAIAWTVFAVVLGPTGLGTYLGVLAWTASDPGFASAPIVSTFGPTFSLVAGETLLAAIALAAMWRHRGSLRITFAIGLVGTLASAVHLHEYDYVGLVAAAWLVLGAERVSAFELGWMAIGIVCGQLPAIGIRWPIVLWTPLWLLVLWLRPAETGQTIPSSQRASSDMRSGVHTGS